MAPQAAAVAPSPAPGRVPDPGAGVPPPGSEQFVTVLQWGAWLVTAACVAGVLVVAGTMAIRHRRGDGGAEAAGGLAWVLFACVLVSSAGPVVAAIVR